MKDTKHEVLHFWFTESQPSQLFQINDAFDEQIRERFAITYDMAKDGLSHHWADDADGALALCIVLSQFPRRMFRGTPEAYASDETARLISKKAIASGFDQMMPHEKKFFLYIPIEYSETIADQEINLKHFKAMERDNPIAYSVAQRRYDTIKTFGRFPERNAALGRENTPEEAAYLEKLGMRI